MQDFFIYQPSPEDILSISCKKLPHLFSTAVFYTLLCEAHPPEGYKIRCALWVYFVLTFHIVLIV